MKLSSSSLIWAIFSSLFIFGCGGDQSTPLPGGAGGRAVDSAGGGTGENTTTARIAAAGMRKGFNLGQMFDNTQHPRTLEAAAAKIDAYYERGYRNVRIPITWTEEVGGNRLVHDPLVGDINLENPRLAVIESVIDHALSKPDLYVVINAHHEHALKDESRAAVLERLWHDIVLLWGDRDPRLLFEILNEPHREDTTPMPAAELRQMTGMAYEAIRAENPTRIVIIGGNQWFGANEVPTVWKSLDEVGGGNDPYVMATFHHYDPWTFCGDDQGAYDDAWTEEQISGPMETMQAWANSVGKGMPVYIGEWGVAWASRYSTLTCNNVRHWYTTFQSLNATPRGLAAAVWDDGGWFKLFDHDTKDFNNNLSDCIDGQCEWNGTERMNAGCD